MSLELDAPAERLREDFYRLETVYDLANLLDLSEERLIYHLYVIPPHKKYTPFSIPKASGDNRSILAPNPELKIIQQKLNQVLHVVYDPPKTTHGFVIGRNVASNAALHIKKRFVFNIDLEDFFPSINFGRVRGLFMASPYQIPARAATILAQICCFQNQLPQGAPTSPTISNMICHKLDRELLGLAWKEKCIYTRYADDITFSTTRRGFPESIAKWVKKDQSWVVGSPLKQIVGGNGFLINPKKVRMGTYMESQRVTGLVTNERLNVPRKYIRQIRAMLHAWEKYGLSAAEVEYLRRYEKKYRGKYKQKPRFNEVVKGKIEFLGMVRGKDDEIYLGFLGKFNSLLAQENPKDREQMRKFFGIYPETEALADEEFKYSDEDERIQFPGYSWINKSPSPIAAILQSYEYLSDDEKDYAYLLKAFETLIEFIGIVLLSGLYNDPEKWQEIMGKLGRQGNHFLKAPGIGDWCSAIRSGSKIIRTLLNSGKESKERLFYLFGFEDERFYELLSNKDLIKIFERVRDRRNDSAHGGAISKLDENLTQDLVSMLDNTVKLFGDFWDKYWLIQPKSSVRKEDHFSQSFDLLRGPYLKFRKDKLIVQEALFERVLYLQAQGTDKALKLLPLIRLEEINSNISVVYFYNRSEKDQAKFRFVSYHYEAKPELSIESEEINRLLRRTP